MDKTERSFTVLGVKKPGQKMRATTKHAGRYISKTPMAAAKKALTQHCSSKRIRGTCTLVIVVKETTAGSAHKVYAYKGSRKRKDTTVVRNGTEVTYKYTNTVHSVPVPKYTRSSTKKRSSK